MGEQTELTPLPVVNNRTQFSRETLQKKNKEVVCVCDFKDSRPISRETTQLRWTFTGQIAFVNSYTFSFSVVYLTGGPYPVTLILIAYYFCYAFICGFAFVKIFIFTIFIGSSDVWVIGYIDYIHTLFKLLKIHKKVINACLIFNVCYLLLNLSYVCMNICDSH